MKATLLKCVPVFLFIFLLVTQITISIAKPEDPYIQNLQPVLKLKPFIGDMSDIQTEAVLAFIMVSIRNNVSKSDFNTFFEEFSDKLSLDNSFEASRIGKVERIGGLYYALYKTKDPTSPVLVLLKFSKYTADKPVKSGSLLELEDGTRVLVEAKDIGEAPKAYSVKDIAGINMIETVTSLVTERSSATGAMHVFFTGAAFQEKRLDIFAAICNRLLDAAEARVGDKQVSREFLYKVIRNITELAENTEVSQSIQLMAGQALTVMSWIDRGVPGAENIRLTAEEEKMVKNDDRGKSFIDVFTLPEGVTEVKGENQPGLYWRGTEKVAKLGDNNIPEYLVFNETVFDSAKDKVVMYLMDHGFLKVGDPLASDTGDEGISTIHETSFINDLLPGSFQTTSTGAGHFQGMKVDVKQVSEGRGIQVNVLYDDKGNMVKVFAQMLQEGDWTLALPGCVDYMINLGGLRFNDFSIYLDEDTAKKLNPDVDFSKKNIAALKAAVSEKGKTAPYLGVRVEEDAFLLENSKGAPDIVWTSAPEISAEAGNILEMYKDMSSGEKKLDEVKELVSDARRQVITSGMDVFTSDEVKEKARKNRGYKAASLERTGGIYDYIEQNSAFIGRALSGRSDERVIIRVPVEAIEGPDKEWTVHYLRKIQEFSNTVIELYSVNKVANIPSSEYEKYGLDKKDLPKAFPRRRDNTITLLPVLKGEYLSGRGKEDVEWTLAIGGLNPADTVISPIGQNYDKAGVVRGITLGLRLREIARQTKERGKADKEFVEETLAQYRQLCHSQGADEVDLEMQDIINMAAGDINDVVRALNKVTQSLPILPMNAEEVRSIYERAHKTLSAA